MIRCALSAWALALGFACSTDESRAPDAAAPAMQAGASGQAPDASAGADARTEPSAVPYREPPLPMPVRTSAVACQLTGTRADALPRVQAEPLLDDLRFPRALGLTARAGAPGLLYVWEQHGLLQRVDASAQTPAAEVMLDLEDRVDCCTSGGLRGVAFHPDYARNGWLFVHYVTRTNPVRSRIVRFSADPATDHVDPASERPVLELALPGSGREGGPLLFDAEGKLLIALGDGGEAAQVVGARPRDLHGALLRIDVDGLDQTGRYAIPADNPFAAATDGTPPEILAWGFRDPQACGLDPSDGTLVCSDRGPTQSELNRIEAGRSYGWPVIEGALCTDTGQLCLDPRYERPQASYRHFEGQCGIVGGVVHASAEPALLEGVIAHGDACSGVLAGIALRGPQRGKRGQIGVLEGGVRALGNAGDGGLLAVDVDGALFRLTLAPNGTPGTFPERLSETGCYADLAQALPAEGLIEFRVRSPLWSDATHKRRFLFVPDGARITAPATGAWDFPVGTILMKQFALQFDDRDPSSVRPIETRFVLHQPEGWEFHSYRWNADGTDAELVTQEETVPYTLQAQGAAHVQEYQFPGPNTCAICHAVAPGRVLGPRTEQLNYPVRYADGAEARNQLEVLAALGLFDMPEGELPSLPDPSDPALPLEQRARSYLHANCSHCHQPEGWSSPGFTMDLRYGLSLRDAHICGEKPMFFREGRALIAPGAPDDSAILIRMRATDLDRMPPVATQLVDPSGERLVADWVRSLTGCPL